MDPADDAWYVIDNIEEIDSPSLVVYPRRVMANIRRAKEIIGDVARLRPHVKTHKSPDVVRLQLAEGISRFKCATIAEAEMLALSGARDVLLAYQPVGPKIVRLRELTRRFPATAFSCLIDDAGAAKAIAEVFAPEPAQLRVFVDLNIGMNRTGISPGASALHLYNACTEMHGIHAVGLHAYDGHIHDTDLAQRTARCEAAFATVRTLSENLTRTGAASPIVVAGGSPTFPIHARRPSVECSPGTFIFWDKEYLDGLPEQAFSPAALVISRVIGLPADNLLCLDLGHKSIAAEKELQHRVFFLNAPEAAVVAQSEEHLVVRLGHAERFGIGDVLYGLPFHICPTCALYERAVTVVDGRAEGEWRMTARDRVIGV